MAGKMILAVLLGLPVSVSSANCAASMKMKTTLTNLYCSTSAMAAATCGSCCMADPLTCGGIGGISCATGMYAGPMMTGDAWKMTATTASTKNTDCCTAQATCASTGYSCAAGWKKKTGVDATKCSADAASCGTTTCCMMDPLKCGGIGSIACASGFYSMSSDAWKNTATTASTKNTDCCTAMATCASTGYSCAAGWKAKTGVTATKCSTNAASCATTTCCMMDPLKCGGIGGIACATGTYPMSSDTWKGTATTASTKNTDCCTAQATCAAFQTDGNASGAQQSQPAAIMVLALIVVVAAAGWQ